MNAVEIEEAKSKPAVAAPGLGEFPFAQARRIRCALARSAMFLFCSATLFWLPHTAAADETTLPPGRVPIEVAVGIFLANLSGATERNETFDADLYLNFSWHDPRLAFAGTGPKHFLEDAAVEQLKQMWWPEFEFGNASAPDVANRTLGIFPDGSVSYRLAVTATFRSDLDLRRFPLDRDILEVRIQSFLWTQDQMAFVPDLARIGFNPHSTYDELIVSRVSSDIRSRDLPGWTPAERFSEFAAQIAVERRPSFYIWTVFVPVVLIFLVSCTIFAIPIESIADRIATSLTALLACIAMQFTVSFSLPQVSYLTVIGWTFVATYFCITLGVLMSMANVVFHAHRPERAMWLDRFTGLALPVLFFSLIALIVLR